MKDGAAQADRGLGARLPARARADHSQGDVEGAVAALRIGRRDGRRAPELPQRDGDLRDPERGDGDLEGSCPRSATTSESSRGDATFGPGSVAAGSPPTVPGAAPPAPASKDAAAAHPLLAPLFIAGLLLALVSIGLGVMGLALMPEHKIFAVALLGVGLPIGAVLALIGLAQSGCSTRAPDCTRPLRSPSARYGCSCS